MKRKFEKELILSVDENDFKKAVVKISKETILPGYACILNCKNEEDFYLDLAKFYLNECFESQNTEKLRQYAKKKYKTDSKFYPSYLETHYDNIFFEIVLNLEQTNDFLADSLFCIDLLFDFKDDYSLFNFNDDKINEYLSDKSNCQKLISTMNDIKKYTQIDLFKIAYEKINNQDFLKMLDDEVDYLKKC